MKELGFPSREMLDKIPTLAWSCLPDGTAEFLNQRWIDYTGLSSEAAAGWGWQAAIHPDIEKLMGTWLHLLKTEGEGEEEARLRRFDGGYRWFLFRAIPVQLDVTDESSVASALNQGLAAFGGIDVLVNNAGIGLFSAFEATPLTIVRELFETNTFGVMAMTQAGQGPLSVQEFVRKHAATFIE